MRHYALTYAAEQDIEDIVTYIAQDNPPAALKLLDNFYEDCSLLTEIAYK